ncbi:MAG: fused MFS/spermidine synthase [Trueperella sp.]|nr:fused MFS/spermidine synthase [Trueperella sp.]
MSELTIATRGSLVTLFVDGVESSAIDLTDPHYLEFEYLQQMRIVLNTLFGATAPLRVLHLGGAACAFARAIAADRPNSRQLAIEVDPQLAQYVRQWFDLPRAPQLRIRAQDARTTLDTNNGSWQVIVRDAFRRGRIPLQLATAQAHAKAANLLTPDGVYLLNIAGEAGLEPMYREVAGLLQSFDYLLAIADPAIMKGRRFGNVVLCAAHSPLPTVEIDRLVRKLPLPTIVVPQAKLVAGAQSTVPYTDAENLLGRPAD